jgi:hypothetical protein
MEAESSISESAGAKNGNQKTTETQAGSPSEKSSPRKKRSKRSRAKAGSKRTRSPRPYPSTSFLQSLPLAEAIHQYASGMKVRRLTLLQKMQRSATSSATFALITNSGKYGITTGSYAAEWLELTPLGSKATAPGDLGREKLSARFKLAIEDVQPFNHLYLEYRGKKLPSQEVMKDALAEKKFDASVLQEAVDTFVVNAKDLGLIQTIAGSETLFPIEQRLEELSDPQIERGGSSEPTVIEHSDSTQDSKSDNPDWSKVCFIITPIGDEGSEERKHSDLFLNALIEPALKEFGLKVVRAD